MTDDIVKRAEAKRLDIAWSASARDGGWTHLTGEKGGKRHAAAGRDTTGDDLIRTVSGWFDRVA